jgi:Cupin domain.
MKLENLSRRTFMAFAAGGTVALAAGKVHAHEATVATYPANDPRHPRDPGPHDPIREGLNPDIVDPPATDSGTLPNLRFSFSDAHVRKGSGGWTRQVTQRELGISTTIAGVDMRLDNGGIRELHWHKEGEWAYMLYGNARITALDTQGGWFVDDVGVGDLWYFPPGVPHSIQGARSRRLRVFTGL